MADLKKMEANPNYAVEMAMGPPFPELTAQASGSGIEIAKVYSNQIVRYVLKAAHLSKDDYRIFDANGQLVMNMHHPGKNPLDSLDPLGVSYQSQQHDRYTFGEWEAHCDVTGRCGMPNLKIRPKTVSRHGRQYVKDHNDRYYLSIAKKSKLSTKSILPHYEVCRGEDEDAEVYSVVGDLMERTMQIQNEKGEVVAFVQKSIKALILSQTLGGGSEMIIDIAPGVDCSTVLAIVFAMKQVGAHYVKDALGNFVTDPLKDSVVGSAMDQSGGAGSMLTNLSNQAVRFGRLFQK